MSLNVYSAIKLARTLAEQSGLTVVFEDECAPRTDGRHIYVERPADTWDEKAWTKWWGVFYHEIGHNDPDMRDCFTIAKKNKIDMNSFFGTGLNVIDDHRQEHHRIEEYYGRKMALSAAHNMAMGEIIANEVIGKDDTNEERQAIETLLAYDTYCREPWMPHVQGKADEICRQLTPQSLEWFQRLTDKHDHFDLAKLRTAEQEYRLLKEILELFDINADEKEQEAQATYKPGEGKVRYDDLLKHKHDMESGSIYTPMSIDYEGCDTSPVHWEIAEQHVIDYRKTPARPTQHYTDRINRLGNSGKGLANTVRRLLQIRSKAKRIFGQKKGKLANRSLHRLAVDQKGYSERVFSQKIENNILDVAVCVLGDASGSMGGSKYCHMAQSAILLNEALSTINVPVEILTFSDESRHPTIGLLKAYTEKVNRETLVDRFSDFSRHMANNADGESILYAYSRLVSQKQKRKVLVVLSDGSPATHRGNSYRHTIEVVKRIEQEGRVEIYGIGIQDDNVTRIYKDREVIHSPDELERALINVVKTKILS